MIKMTWGPLITSLDNNCSEESYLDEGGNLTRRVIVNSKGMVLYDSSRQLPAQQQEGRLPPPVPIEGKPSGMRR